MVGWHPQYNGHGFGWTPRSWWWTGRPGVLQFMRSQRVGRDWATELNWTELRVVYKYSEPYPVSCFADTEAPSPGRRRRLCEERMITQWPDKSCDVSYSTSHNSENCPKKWEQTLKLEINCTQNNQEDAHRTTTSLILRWLSEPTIPSCSLPPCIQPLNSPIKTSALWATIRSWFADTSPPSPQVADLQNKVAFPFPCLPMTGFRVMSSQTWVW